MDAWAVKYGSSVAFICVSCAGPQLASTFGNELKLAHCHNTWADEDDMPTWGQLGCNGLIVIDGDNNVVCKASPAFLEVKGAAFRHVETLLAALLSSGSEQGPSKIPKLPSGRVDGAVGGHCAEVRFGEDDHGGVEEEEEVAAIADVQSLKVGSVKVDMMDEEHELCEKKLKLLDRLTEPPGVGGRTGQIERALQGLLAAYEDHFAHEESLLDAYLYANVLKDGEEFIAKGSFSADKGARTSHFADHQAMLSSVRRLLEDVPSVSGSDVRKLARRISSGTPQRTMAVTRIGSPRPWRRQRKKSEEVRLPPPRGRRRAQCWRSLSLSLSWSAILKRRRQTTRCSWTCGHACCAAPSRYDGPPAEKHVASVLART